MRRMTMMLGEVLAVGGWRGFRPVLLLLVALLWLSGCGAPAPLGAAPAAAPSAASASPPAATATPDQLAAPSRVRLSGLDVDVPVVAVGVDDRGEMEIPENVNTVGWYRFGPAPGADAGSSVLSGHVDDRVQGRGAFYRLTDVAEGDLVEVELADGTVLAYRVSVVERIDKSALPVDQLFARAGAPRLTLVTCGGPFDQATRNYRDNVVVTAEPI